MKIIDNFLRSITMYTLMLYFLLVLVGVAVFYSFIGVLAFSPWSIVFSTIVLMIICLVANKVFAAVFKVAVNPESAYITALILSLLFTPVKTIEDFEFLALAAFLAIASKFILAIKGRHLFNPAATAAVVLALGFNHAASWWVGTSSMLPFILAGGLLLLRKIRKDDMVLSFLLVTLATTLSISFLQKGSDPFNLGKAILINSPILFFALVMLTEPRTTPPTKTLQILYGGLVGLLMTPQLNVNGLYTTPEIALVGGNVFSYVVSPRGKTALNFLLAKFKDVS